MDEHPLLRRQLRKLGLSRDIPPDPVEWRQLLDRVDQAYAEADQDRYTNERSLALTSQELSKLNADLAEANKVLLRSFADIELLVSSIPAVIIGVDLDGRVSRWNIPAAKVLGIAEDSALQQPFTGLGIRWDWNEVGKMIAESMSTQSVRECGSIRHLHPDGNEGFLQLSVNPSARNTGQGLAYLLLGIDITERKAMEGQHNHLMKMESIGQLAAGIAHEINTPIQFVGDNLHFLSDSASELRSALIAYERLLVACRAGVVPPGVLAEAGEAAARADVPYLIGEIPKAIAQAIEGVERVAKIVQAMKEFSHPDRNEKQQIDLNHALMTTLTVACSEYKYIADVTTDLFPDLPAVAGNPGELNQVFLNLIVNAAHAISDVVKGGDRGRIGISTRHDGSHVEVRISDTGTGIPEAIREQVFDPFFTTKDVGKGTGQGLYLADMIVRKKHGGQIRFETCVGAGTTFIVRLPIAV